MNKKYVLLILWFFIFSMHSVNEFVMSESEMEEFFIKMGIADQQIKSDFYKYYSKHTSSKKHKKKYYISRSQQALCHVEMYNNVLMNEVQNSSKFLITLSCDVSAIDYPINPKSCKTF